MNVAPSSIFAVLAAAAAGAAHAGEPVKVSVEGETSVVAAAREGDVGADVDGKVRFKASTVQRSGLEYGAVLEARLDGQQQAQTPAGGRYSSLLIGGPRGVAPLTSDLYLQSANAYVRGAFGTLIVGRDQGVGRTLSVTAPTIFRAINVNDWRSDLSGLNDVHTVNDFSGYSSKITYLPPANLFGGVVGGLQLGVSYSPALRNCGDRLCAPVAGFTIAPDGTVINDASRWEDVLEGAFYYQKGLGKGADKLTLGLGGSIVTAKEDVRATSQLLGDYEAYALGLNVGYRGITLGGSVKTTNAGLAQVEDDGYFAFDAGVTYRTGAGAGDWGFMVGYGQAEATVIGPRLADPLLFRDTQTTQAGVTYFVGRGVTVGAAAQYVQSKRPEAEGGREEAASAVLEVSLKF